MLPMFERSEAPDDARPVVECFLPVNVREAGSIWWQPANKATTDRMPSLSGMCMWVRLGISDARLQVLLEQTSIQAENKSRLIKSH